jgi:hypothetical protein
LPDIVTQDGTMSPEVAVLGPARRAARVDFVTILRHG